MFLFNGMRSKLSQEAQSLLDGLGVLSDRDGNRSFTTVLYHIDLRDGYQYLLAHAGLRQVEPMFGPKTQDDFRQLGAMGNPRGFRQREGIPESEGEWHRTIRIGPDGELWVSRRADACWEQWEAVSGTLMQNLERLLQRQRKNDNAPLYPELWFKEREARDRLRSAVASLGRVPDMRTVAGNLTHELQVIYGQFPEINRDHIQIGIYLFTGEGWELCGREPAPPALPKNVARRLAAKGILPNRAFPEPGNIQSIDKEHAFEWVYTARRSVLLRFPLSTSWVNRLHGCALHETITQHRGSLCIVPILDSLNTSLAVGLLVISARGAESLNPAHLYLASRLSSTLAGYLGIFMPIPGFPWWPDAKLARGGARIEDSHSSVLHDLPDVREIVEDLLPTGATVRVSPLEKGLTNSVLFRIDAWDEKGVQEIPRVLKLGPAALIGDELHRYYRYVHNKNVGGQARVDLARGYPHKRWREVSKTTGGADSRGVGAIIYTFVSMGEKAARWAEWAKTASLQEVEFGIGRLKDHLHCWHVRSKGESGRLSDVAIPDAILQRQLSRLQEESGFSRSLQNPTVKETVDLLREIKNWFSGVDRIVTSIVHGDTHCGNVFALLNQEKKITDVALIDWGKVSSGCHSSVDTALLLSDLMFGVRWMPGQAAEITAWGEDQFNKFETGNKPAASVVWLVHTLRMLTWRRQSDGRPVWNPDARANAWSWVKKVWTNVR